MTRIDPKPPDQQKLQASRELKLKQKKMKYIIYDIVWYFIFVTVLLSVAHGNKDEVAYGTTATMSNYFETSSYTNWIDLDEVLSSFTSHLHLFQADLFQALIFVFYR
jgi:hypothetical protein